MSCTDRTAPHLPDRYARRLLRVHADLATLTEPCWIDDVLDHCADGLAFSIQLTNARNTLDDLGIVTGDDAPDQKRKADGVLTEDSMSTHGKFLQAAHAAAAQGELLGLDVGQRHPAPESATATPCTSRGGISESAGEMQ